MEFGTREILILLGIIIILGILLDGFRRVRHARSGSLRSSRRKGGTDIFDDDPMDPGADLATSEVRVTRRDPDSVEQVSNAMRQSRERLAGQCTSAYREISQARGRGADEAPGEDGGSEEVPELQRQVAEEPSSQPEPGSGEGWYAPEELEGEDAASGEEAADEEPTPIPEFYLDPEERIEPTFATPGEQSRSRPEPDSPRVEPPPQEVSPADQREYASSDPESAPDPRGSEPPARESASQHRDRESWGREEGAEGPRPEEVLVLHVMARKGGHFEGTALLNALLENGLRFGSMEIFHRHEDADGSGPVLFSLANSLKPGTFDLSAMEEFSTPGVTLFMPLQGLQRPLDTFSLMLETARALSKRLDGELKDETRSALTRQTIEHYRQQIIEFTRRSFTLTS